jgi:uncharacterized protein YajQ (UPF0234 family)|tara:strand:+ start:3866 stop:4348 length:483 start_codon:yes stop_codon:yes gene_type:complete
MPTFDAVSEVDHHELSNAIDQANREIGTRYDFKGSDSKIEQSSNELTLISESEFQIKQMAPILKEKMAKRGIDVSCLDFADIIEMNKKAKQQVTVKEGLDKDIARKIVKLIKESKIKVQAAIQDEQVRVTGKKRDELQQVMQLLRESDLGIPLQFNNFRD